MTQTPSLPAALPWLLAGAALSYFVGWTPNFVVATWIVPILLLRGSRGAPAWASIAVVLPLLSLVGIATVRGAWHMGLPTELGFSLVLSLPLTGALLADRLLHHRLNPLAASFVFPSVWVLFDYAYSHIYGLGDVFSPALTQFQNPVLLQVVSITGIYGITFAIGWTATVVADAIALGDNNHRWTRPLAVLAAAGTLVAFYGSARLSSMDHDVPTVRVASIVVPHERDYHGEIIDRGTPRAEADGFRSELQALEDELFLQSESAATGGARILFWAETAAVLYKDHEQDYLARGAEFARKHGIYLQTASLVMRYDDPMIENQITLFTPEGEVAYTYLKTQTWYPTESDAVIHAHETPWGTISSVICFDLDVPHWMRQVAALDVDILLVPGFDTRPISPYHTEAGLFRAVEGGYSIVRGVNDGTSMAVDPEGRILALQDSFRTDERILYIDVPTQGRTTVYGVVGDWVPAFCFVLFSGLVLLSRRMDAPHPRPAHQG